MFFYLFQVPGSPKAQAIQDAQQRRGGRGSGGALGAQQVPRGRTAPGARNEGDGGDGRASGRVFWGRGRRGTRCFAVPNMKQLVVGSPDCMMRFHRL